MNAVYAGRVRHARLGSPRAGGADGFGAGRVFDHELYLPYVDLATLADPFPGSRLWGPGPLALVRYRRSDYLGDPAVPLDLAVRDEVERLGGDRPEGPVRMLAHLRSFGWCFNPVALYYCFDPGGRRLRAVLADVTNTPWGEHHTYLVPAGDDGVARAVHDKALHVSPFLTMDMAHRFRLSSPDRRLSVVVENRQDGRPVFRATMTMRRRPASPAELRRLLARRPLMTARVSAAIYTRAARLRLAGAPLQRHPVSRPQAEVKP